MTYSKYPNRYTTTTAVSKKRSYNFHKFFGLAVVALALFVIFKIDLQVRAADHAAALAAQQKIKSQQAAFEASVKNIMSTNPLISFSVSVIDNNTSANQTIGNAATMQAASVGKLLTASLYLHQVEQGQASLSQKIDGLSAKTQLRLLINQSDDNAWQALNDHLGHPALRAYAAKLGIYSYDPNYDMIKASDVAKLLQKLYDKDLLNQADTNLLLSWMQHTNYEEFISPAVGPGYSIYHKVGLVDDNVNDAAIISSGSKSLELVIFTNGHGVQNWDQRAALMQQVAKAAENDYLKD